MGGREDIVRQLNEMRRLRRKQHKATTKMQLSKIRRAKKMVVDAIGSRRAGADDFKDQRGSLLAIFFNARCAAISMQARAAVGHTRALFTALCSKWASPPALDMCGSQARCRP